MTAMLDTLNKASLITLVEIQQTALHIHLHNNIPYNDALREAFDYFLRHTEELENDLNGK